MSVNPEEGGTKKVRRFTSAYILFFTERQGELRRELERRGVHVKTTEITKMVAKEWRAMNCVAREPWEAESLKDRHRYEAEKTTFLAACKGKSSGHRRTRILKDENAPKRPKSAYLLYANERRAEMKRQHPDASNGMVSKLLGDKWKHASKEEKSEYLKEAVESQQQYQKVNAEWKKTKPKAGSGKPLKKAAAKQPKRTSSKTGDKRHGEKTSAGQPSVRSSDAQLKEDGQPAPSHPMTQRVSNNSIWPCESVLGKAPTTTTQTMATASGVPIGTGNNLEMNQRVGGSRQGPPAALEQRVTQLPSQVDLLTSGFGGRYFVPSSAASAGLQGGGSLLQDAGGSSRLPGLLGQQNGELGSLPTASFLNAAMMVEAASLADRQQHRMSQWLGTGPASVAGAGISLDLPPSMQQQILQRQIANQLPVQQMDQSNVLQVLLHQGQMPGGLNSFRRDTVQGAAISDAAASALLPMMTNTNDARLSTAIGGDMHHAGGLASLVAPTVEIPAGAESRRADLLQLLALREDVKQELAERSVRALVLQQQQQLQQQLRQRETIGHNGGPYYGPADSRN